jgi:hypothetical protein
VTDPEFALPGLSRAWIRAAWSLSSIDLVTMAEDEQVLVVYLVDDAVVRGSYSPLAGPADELGAGWGPRVGREQIDSSL